MNLEQIKQHLFSTKVSAIMKSEFEFLYRDTIDFILNKYLDFSRHIPDEEILKYLLPIASLPDFQIKFITETEKNLNIHLDEILKNIPPKPNNPKILRAPANEENELLSLILLKYSRLNSEQIKDKISLFTIEQKEILFDKYFQADPELKLLNFLPYTIELCVDIQTLQQLKKHLGNALIIQPFSIHHHYHIPKEILNSGDHGEYIQVMKRALYAYEKMLPQLSTQAFYIIPLAFLQKVIFTISINQLAKLNFPIIDDILMEIKKINPTIYQAHKNKIKICDTKN